MASDPAAETGDGGTPNQALPEEIQARLKEIFAWLQKDARDQIRDVDHFEEMLDPISQKLLKTLNLPWSPSRSGYVDQPAIPSRVKNCQKDCTRN
jgi:hypothetical protein